MSESLLSVGIDIGTSTTQLIFSRLHLANRANAFSVPDIRISEKEILYRSGIHFTPLLSDDRIDAQAIAGIVDKEYALAGIRKEDIATGAVIITGETARKENAAQAAEALSGYAGDFVVATAGPALESELAARGAGAEEAAKGQRAPLIHIDIGGGTSNIAVYADGKLLDTGCVNVGGRLLRLSGKGEVLWRSKVLDGLCQLNVGDIAEISQLEKLCKLLTLALEEAVGKRPPTELSERLTTDRLPKLPLGIPSLSFSGGVGALLDKADVLPPLAYGDLGVLLARAIRSSRLMEGQYRICPDAIRATVIGAGCHATSLSGSTVFYQNVRFPLHGLPVAVLSEEETALEPADLAAAIVHRMEKYGDDALAAVYLPLAQIPDFSALGHIADGLAMAGSQSIVTVTQFDCAKALGQALSCRVERERSILCLDALSLRPGTYLDIGAPVAGGEAIPVIIKTLIFST